MGAISAAIELGRLPEGELPGGPKQATPAPVTVNQELLRMTGLVRSLDKPLRILGSGEVSRPMFVVADAFTKSAREKIEGAGGTVQVIEIPTSLLAAIGVEPPAGAD